MKLNLIKYLFVILIFTGFTQGQTLEEYFQIAADNNPGLQAEYKEYKAALLKVPQVSSLPDPTFSFGYFIEPVETRVGPQKAKFSLTQMFPWFGTLKAQGNAAARMAEAKFQAFLDAKNKLYYDVAAAYYPIYELNRIRQIEQENVTLLDAYKTIALQKFQNGEGTMVNVLRTDIMLKDAQTNLDILNTKEMPLLASFNQLLNREANEPVAITDTLLVIPLPDNAVPDSMLVNNPNLFKFELLYESQQAAEKAAFRQGLPKFGLGLDYVLVDERTDMDVPDNGKDVIMPMVSISLPIFRGKYKAAREEAKLMQESYRLKKEDLHNTLIAKYEMIKFEITKKQKLIELYVQQIEESKQMLNLLYTAYSNSGKDFEEVLRMEQKLLKYRKLKASALSEYHIALEKLNYITATHGEKKIILK
ncbi:MAG: TolC family protein [Calditrichaceae bacterium]|nr:TolC family protein [Calditrichaceae bacterium]